MAKLIQKVKNKVKSISDERAFRAFSAQYPIRVMSSVETIRYIREKHCSVARYGDGELNMILSDKSIGFQKYNPELARELERVLYDRRDDLLLCLPHEFEKFSGEKLLAKDFWKTFLREKKPAIWKLLEEHGMKGYRFGDTQTTRPYMDYVPAPPVVADTVYPAFKALWAGKKVLIVEGDSTRMGRGNDLFDSAAALRRVVCPAENAFARYAEILATVKAKAADFDMTLLALGPTATVLAADLSRAGIWALDVGHLDVEYEWYRSGAKEKTVLKNKYVNELAEGRIHADESDKEYLSQILARIQ